MNCPFYGAPCRLLAWLLVGWLLSGVGLVAQAPTAPKRRTPLTNSIPAQAREPSTSINPITSIQNDSSPLTLGLDRIGFLREPVFGRPLWQYLSTLLYIALAFLTTRILDAVLRYHLGRWSGLSSARWGQALSGMTGLPVKLLIFGWVVNLGLELVEWPPWIESGISKIGYVAIGVALVLMVLKVIDVGLEVWRMKLPPDGDRAFNEHLLRMVGKLLKAFAVIIGVFTLFSHLGIDIRAALASVSVAGLALGLAAQDTVANLFGAVTVFIDRPFRIGERIRVGEVDGIVEDMGIRATRVRSLDGYLITIPNKTVGNSTITNLSSRTAIRTEMNLGLTYGTSSERVEAAVRILDEIFRTHPKTKDVTVSFNRFLDSALNLNVVYTCATIDLREFGQILQSMNLRIKARFDAEGLEFAYPTQTTIHQFPVDSGAPSVPIVLPPRAQVAPSK